MVKKGDTLIEVVLAVGIFSLVAIAVASVMNGGTSSAQSALEVVLAREEIDVQAEALRFIQSAYIADKDSNNEYYSKIWKQIKDNAVRLKQGEASTEEQKLLSFSPTTCDELYSENGEVFKYKAFILNPRRLGEDPKVAINDRGNNAVYVSAADAYTDTGTFHSTETYPRVLYKGDNENQLIDTNDSFLNGKSIYRAEGIYIIAVEDASNTVLIPLKDTHKKEYAFYDFYIRSCWYGLDADHPSTISTVVRLYNPDALDTNTAN